MKTVYSKHKKSLIAASVLALICVMTVGTTIVACPFCSSPSLTLSEQLAAAHSAVLVKWVSGDEPDKNQGFAGSTTYEIVEVVRDQSESLKAGTPLVLERYRTAKVGDFFLVLGTINEASIDWNSPLEMTERGLKYISAAPSKETAATERMRYYVQFLEDVDPIIATDAYSEFASTQYDDIAPLGPDLPTEKLRGWINDPNVSPTRLGLYGLLLGLGGNEQDAAVLKEKILQETETFRLGIDGVMGGYLLLTGDEGLKVIEESKLQNVNAPFSETFAAMQAMRFMWQFSKGKVSEERLRSAMRILLDRPNLADLVIVDLARWNDWAIMDRLMVMYDDPKYQVPSIKRAIVRFMLITEKSKDAKENAAPAEYVAMATANLQLLRAKDEKTVKAAERFFFD